jgi:hypothetical protein
VEEKEVESTENLETNKLNLHVNSTITQKVMRHAIVILYQKKVIETSNSRIRHKIGFENGQ